MLHNKRILIIEDEADLCLLLSDYFIRNRGEVVISHTLKEGSDLMDKIKADIVVLDNNLPDGSGWDMASAIASKLPNAHIVFISAFQSTARGHVPDGTKFSFLQKPLSIDALNRSFTAISNTVEKEEAEYCAFC